MYTYVYHIDSHFSMIITNDAQIVTRSCNTITHKISIQKTGQRVTKVIDKMVSKGKKKQPKNRTLHQMSKP